MIHDASNNFRGLLYAVAYDVRAMRRLDGVLAFDDAPGEMWMRILERPVRADERGEPASRVRKMSLLRKCAPVNGGDRPVLLVWLVDKGK